jgi:hypothetical protein
MITIYPFTISSPLPNTIEIADNIIDAARLIAFAQEVTHDFAGSYGDDNLGGWRGRPPSWIYRLSCPNATFRIATYKLLTLHGREKFTVLGRAEAKGRTAVPAGARLLKIYAKHTGSQLRDCPFVLHFLDESEQVWIEAEWLDTALLQDLMTYRSRAEVRAAIEATSRRQMNVRAANLDEVVQAQTDEEMARYIDPAYRVFFVMQGHAFRVDRSGAELVLVPDQPLENVGR